MSDQKTALVTGANKGIGYEIVRQLLAKGFQVFLTARNTSAGEKAATALHDDVQFLPMDVTDDKSIENAANAFGQRSEKLDVLVNNAAIYPDEKFDILTITRQQLVKNEHLWPDRSHAGFSAISQKVDRPADYQRLKRLRRNRWPCSHRSQLLSIEADIERRHHHARSSIASRWFRRLCDVPRMGSHRHGRHKCHPIGGGRRRYRRLVGNGRPKGHEREVFSRSQSHRMVKRNRLKSFASSWAFSSGSITISERKSESLGAWVLSKPRYLGASLAGDHLRPITSTTTRTSTIRLVEVRGFEPLTFSLRTRRSTN
jgi:hypothetical protein